MSHGSAWVAHADFIHGQTEITASIIAAGFVLGMICGVLLLLLPYLMKKRYETIMIKKKIELNQNTAYETISPKSTPGPQR